MKKKVWLAGVALLMAGATQAAVISWGTATTVAGDADVSLNGTSEWAYTFGNTAATTVNSQLFAANSGVNGNADVTITTGNNHNNFLAGSTGPYFALSTEYQSLLIGATYTSRNVTSFTATLNGLTIDDEYEVQWWSQDARSYDGRNTVLDGVVTLDYSSTDTVTGGVGQYSIGTFTADATTQVITSTTVNGQVNAMQLRAIPEPATLGLLGLGAFLMILVRPWRNS